MTHCRHFNSAITLLLWCQQWLVDDAPFLQKFALKVTHPCKKRRRRPISAPNVSTVGDSEKCSITTNIKSTTGFLTSHRWNAYVTPKCPKGWLKEWFFVFWVKVNGRSSRPQCWSRITVDICIPQLGRVEEIIWLPYAAGLSAAAKTLVRNP